MKDPVYILGIHDGHNCGATLSRDGAIVAAVSEERLSRKKNAVGYPRRAVAEVLRIGNVEPAELREAVYASDFMHQEDYLTDLKPWYRVGLQQQRAAAQRPGDYQKIILQQRKSERIDVLCKDLGIAPEKISFLDHHLCHIAAAYYTAPNVAPGRPVLGLTCDGAGDNLAGSVSICTDNDIERLDVIQRHASLGKIYSRVTMLMGMTPWEHEYKIMGLAPYADPERCQRAADSLREILELSSDGRSFVQAGELSMNYCYEYLRDSFEGVRFDVVAGATQLFTEELLTNWVASCVKSTGISDVVCGGGVFMNVKANMLISQLPEVTSLYVMPSAADESLSIGACLHRYYQISGQENHSASVFSNLYFGGESDRAAEQEAIEGELAGADIEVAEHQDIDIAVADRLAEGGTVARCRGRMEWGARALGNRSILCSANDYSAVDRINRAIKQRDFWMPFAPSIMAERADRYLQNPKGLDGQFMTFAMPTRRETYGDLIAASHPRDRTVRPQVVTLEANPGYHALISRFEEKTGRGVVLNTSFNLHGYPIVDTPVDAIRVFLNSGLGTLALNNFMINKRNHDDSV